MNRYLARNLIYPTIQVIRRERVYENLRQLEETQWLPREELCTLQFRQLRNLLSHAQATVPYYRNLFRENGIDWRDLSRVEDIESLPILTKETYREDGHQFISESYRGKIDARRTSGSTGVPLVIRKPRHIFSRMRAIMFRYYRWHGIEIGSRQGRILGHPLTFSSKLREDIQDFLLNKFRLDPSDLTTGRIDRYLRRIRKDGADYLYGYPSAMMEITAYAEQYGINLRDLNVPVIICTGENLYNWQRRRLETTFGARVVNEYGCSEFGIIAFECPMGSMHLSTDNLLVEMVPSPDSIDGMAEILITDLFNFGVPLIRYKIGDLAVTSAVDTCPCGRSLTLVQGIEGRESEMIRLDDGRLVHSEFFHYLGDALEEAGYDIRQFRVIRLAPHRYEMEAVVDPKSQNSIERYVTKWMRARLGAETDVQVRAVNNLPRDTSGKFRYFIPRTGAQKRP